jgi:hypothetical protein
VASPFFQISRFPSIIGMEYPEDYCDYSVEGYDYGYDEYGDWDAMQYAYEENCCFLDECYDNYYDGDY